MIHAAPSRGSRYVVSVSAPSELCIFRLVHAPSSSTSRMSSKRLLSLFGVAAMISASQADSFKANSCLRGTSDQLACGDCSEILMDTRALKDKLLTLLFRPQPYATHAHCPCLYGLCSSYRGHCDAQHRGSGPIYNLLTLQYFLRWCD
jgi:hypothetical protein